MRSTVCTTWVLAVAAAAALGCGGGGGGGGDAPPNPTPEATPPPAPPAPPPAGVRYSDAQLCTLKLGSSTADQIVAALGQPTTRATPASDRTTLFYHEGAQGTTDTVFFHIDGGVLHHVGRVGSAVPTCLDQPAPLPSQSGPPGSPPSAPLPPL